MIARTTPGETMKHFHIKQTDLNDRLFNLSLNFRMCVCCKLQCFVTVKGNNGTISPNNTFVESVFVASYSVL